MKKFQETEGETRISRISTNGAESRRRQRQSKRQILKTKHCGDPPTSVFGAARDEDEEEEEEEDLWGVIEAGVADRGRALTPGF